MKPYTALLFVWGVCIIVFMVQLAIHFVRAYQATSVNW